LIKTLIQVITFNLVNIEKKKKTKIKANQK